MELVVALADLLPSGIYTGVGHRGVRPRGAHRRRPHGRLPRARRKELYLAATDLDTCERIVLGAEGWDDVPISSAVRASAALPMVYKPHVVKDRELIDGGIVSTTNLDIAVEAGRQVRRRRQPARPVRQRLPERGRRAARRRAPAARLRPRLHEDRLPDVQADRLPAPARDGAHVGGALPGRRHRADRARARRPPDVRDGHPQLLVAHRHRAPRLPVGDDARSPTTTSGCTRSRRATASRSRRRACARSSSTSASSARRRARGGASSSRRPRAAAPVRLGGQLVELREQVGVLLVDHVALDLQGRRQLAGLLREVVVEDRELLICSTCAYLALTAVEVRLDLRRAPPRTPGRSPRRGRA